MVWGIFLLALQVVFLPRKPQSWRGPRVLVSWRSRTHISSWLMITAMVLVLIYDELVDTIYLCLKWLSFLMVLGEIALCSVSWRDSCWQVLCWVERCLPRWEPVRAGREHDVSLWPICWYIGLGEQGLVTTDGKASRAALGGPGGGLPKEDHLLCLKVDV